MATNTLILTKADYLLWTPISLNIADNIVNMHTRAGQRKYLKIVLGNDLYDKIIQEVEATPTAPYDELINDYIKPFLTTKCYSDILSDGAAISSATGPKSITDTTNNQSEADGTTLGIQLRKIDQSANTFKQELIDYLDDNASSFPEWNSTDSCKSNSTGLFFMNVKKRYDNGTTHTSRSCKRLHL